ncbi:MAG: hypothetical protein WCN88_03100 [Candidatus Falkowbacteria bacterium]
MKYRKGLRNYQGRMFAGSSWLRNRYSGGDMYAGVRTLRRWFFGFC